MSPPVPSSVPIHHPTVHESDLIGSWQINLEADPDDLLVLPRILQKLAVPSIELTGVNYERGATVAHITVRLRCPRAWLQLVRHKLSKLPSVRSLG